MKPVIRPIAVAIALGLFGNSASAQTLEQAVAQAVDSNPTIHNQYAIFKSYLEDQRAAKGRYLPSIDLEYGIGPEWTNSRGGESAGDLEEALGDRFDDRQTRQEFTVRATQLIFDGFGREADIARLGKEAAAARYNLVSEAENLALEITETYLNLLQAQEVLQLTERNLKDHEAIQRSVASKVAQGASSRSDKAQIDARVFNAKTSVMAARNIMLDYEDRYLRLVGKRPYDLIKPVIDSRLLPASVAEGNRRAREYHPELMGALRDVEAANEEVRLTRKNYYPELNLVGEYNDNRNLDGTPGPEEDYSVMLKAKYNIFNGFSDKAKERSSAWRYQQALSIRDRVTRQIDEGITTSWNASRLLRDQEMMLRSNVQEAVSAQKGYQDQFNAGQRSLLDVLDSKVEVFNARKRFLDTHYNRLISEYRMLNSMGALLYALRIESPKEWNEGVKNEDL